MIIGKYLIDKNEGENERDRWRSTSQATPPGVKYAAGLNADALSSNQVSVEQQVEITFKLALRDFDN